MLNRMIIIGTFLTASMTIHVRSTTITHSVMTISGTTPRLHSRSTTPPIRGGRNSDGGDERLPPGSIRMILLIPHDAGTDKHYRIQKSLQWHKQGH